ncbi:MAG TPA: hypothetical protein VF300_04280 [Methanothrix sp.]
MDHGLETLLGEIVAKSPAPSVRAPARARVPEAALAGLRAGMVN